MTAKPPMQQKAPNIREKNSPHEHESTKCYRNEGHLKCGTVVHSGTTTEFREIVYPGGVIQPSFFPPMRSSVWSGI